MSIATYTGGNRNPRNVILEEALLDRISPILRIDQFFDKKPVPMKQGDTIMFQRAIVPTTILSQTSEGINPASLALQYETFSKQAEEYAGSYSATSRAVELGQTDVVGDQAEVLKDLTALTREKVGWVGVYGGTNVIYNSQAITSRGTVNGAITAGRLSLAVRFLQSNKAKFFTEVTKGALEDNTTPVEESYVCLVHTDAEEDIRQVPGFRPKSEVGGMKGAFDGWFGNWQKICFVTNPEWGPILGAGAAVGATGMKSVGGSNIDVYPFVLMGKKAFGRIGLKGMGKLGFGGVKAYTVDGADHADPTAQRVVSSVRWYDGIIELQPAHAIRIEAGVTANPV